MFCLFTTIWLVIGILGTCVYFRVFPKSEPSEVCVAFLGPICLVALWCWFMWGDR